MTERTYKRICYTILMVLMPFVALVLIHLIWDTNSLTGLQAFILWILVAMGITWLWLPRSR